MKIEASIGELSHGLTLLGSLAPQAREPMMPPHGSVGEIAEVVNTRGQTVSGTAGIAAIKACIDLAATGLALADKYVVEVDDDGFETALPDHPVSRLMRNPSRFFNQYTHDLAATNNLLRSGNAYMRIDRSGRDNVTPVRLTLAGCQRIQRRNGRRIYWLQTPSPDYLGQAFQTQPIDERSVIHVTALNPSWDTGVSPSPLAFAWRTASLYQEGLDRLLAMVRQGGYPHYLKVPPGTELTDVLAWFKDWKEFFLDKGVLGNFAPLYAGGEMQSAGWANVDPGLLDMFRFQIAEICRVIPTPQSLIGHHEKGSSVRNANIVMADFLALKKRSLLPLAASYIAEYERKLLQPSIEREFRRTGRIRRLRLRYDFQQWDEAGEAEKTKIVKDEMQSGVFTANEIRRRRYRMRPAEGGDTLPDPAGAGPGRKGPGDRANPSEPPA